MKQQQGAALIVVLSLLAMALMLGLSSVQSSLIDERLAGNYRALAIAQMAAEFEGSERLTIQPTPAGSIDCNAAEAQTMSERNGGDWTQVDLAEAYTDFTNSQLAARYIECQDSLSGNDVYLVEGFVKPEEAPEASYFLRVGVTVDPLLNSPLYPYLEEALGDSVILTQKDGFLIGSSATVDGIVKEVEEDEEDSLPDPTQPVSSDPDSPMDFIDDMKKKQTDGDSDIVATCDLDDSRVAAAKYIYCDNDDEWAVTFDERVEGKTVIHNGDGKDIDLTISSDVNASIVSTDRILINGSSGGTLKGAVWASGEIRFKDFADEDAVNLTIDGALVGGEVDADDEDDEYKYTIKRTPKVVTWR